MEDRSVSEVKPAEPVVTEAEGYKRREERRDRIKVVLEVLTFLAVVIYAGLTYCLLKTGQGQLAQQVLIDRPVIIGHGVAVSDSRNGIPTKVKIAFVNFGQSMSPDVIAVGHIIPGAPNDAPVDPDCRDRNIWPKEKPRTPLAGAVSNTGNSPNCRERVNCAEWEWSLVDGAQFDPAKQRLYVSGCVRYKGLDGQQWFTKFCVIWAGDNIFPVCPDENRNKID